jgi:hypothetical protein
MNPERFEQRLIGLTLLSLSVGYLAMWWAWPMWMAWGHGSLAVFSLAIIAWRIAVEFMPIRVQKAHGIPHDQERTRVVSRRAADAKGSDLRGDATQPRTAHGH